MFRILFASLILFGAVLAADEPKVKQLTAPQGWTGETIALPPGFAPDMALKGTEHIRFAPGMFQPDSKSFFSYAFVFELQPKPELTDAVVKDEFLKYYRGLCQAVLKGSDSKGEVDPSKFTLELKRLMADKTSAAPDSELSAVVYTGSLNWVEPFATKKAQKLNLDIRTWSRDGRNYLFACVSPQPMEAEIWKELHGIRDQYLKP